MDEQASFETQSVLTRRRAARSRLAMAVPALAFALVAWAGLQGPKPDVSQATNPPAPAVARPTEPQPTVPLLEARGAGPAYPAVAVGLPVVHLVDVGSGTAGPNDEIAVAGWYVPTAITECPPLPALYRDGSLPELRGDADALAFCVRSGVLFATRPDLEQLPTTSYFEDNRSKSAGLPAVPATMVVGVIAPVELERIGASATPVVVLARLIAPADCAGSFACGMQLAIDHVAWVSGVTAGTATGAGGQPRLPADGVNVLTGG